MLKTIGGAILFLVAGYILWRVFFAWKARRDGIKPYRPGSPPPRAGLGQERDERPREK